MKRTTSRTQMDTYQPSGSFLQIYWDEQTETRETMDGETEIVYSYAFANAKTTDSYEELVVKIIRSQYSVDDEFECINDGGESHAQFLAFRDQAKQLAKGWIDYKY